MFFVMLSVSFVGEAREVKVHFELYMTYISTNNIPLSISDSEVATVMEQ